MSDILQMIQAATVWIDDALYLLGEAEELAADGKENITGAADRCRDSKLVRKYALTAVEFIDMLTGKLYGAKGRLDVVKEKLDNLGNRIKGGTAMKLVYICHPYRSAPEFNRDCCENIAHRILRLGRSIRLLPVSTQVYLPAIGVDDEEFAMACCRRMVSWCDELWIFGERVTDGMREEIKLANKLGICIRYVCPYTCPPVGSDKRCPAYRAVDEDNGACVYACRREAGFDFCGRWREALRLKL